MSNKEIMSNLTFGNRWGKKMIKVSEFLCKDGFRSALMGVYYHNGDVVASDSHIMVVLKKSYDESNEGKIITPKGKESPGQYPDYQSAIRWTVETPMSVIPADLVEKMRREIKSLTENDRLYVVFSGKEGRIGFRLSELLSMLRLANVCGKAAVYLHFKGLKMHIEADGVFAVATSIYLGDGDGEIKDSIAYNVNLDTGEVTYNEEAKPLC